jgi:hypothetical protein
MKQRILLKIAIESGLQTIAEFATFYKKYNNTII